MSGSCSRFKSAFPVLLVALVSAVGGPSGHGSPPGERPSQATPAYRLSGPYVHENLAVFLIHGEDSVKGKNFLTLPEALAQKKVVVHETKNVNQLSIENTSQEEVFVQSGDIVKGGQQDRVIAYDLIVPAQSGKIPIASFCVEAGRWRKRGSENAAQFGACLAQCPTKDLKMAVRQSKEQQEVWKNVAKAQMQLEKNVGQTVQAPESTSSLQLTLENGKLKETTESYAKKLASIVDDKKDVIGYAVAINGKINSADIYLSHGLFLKVWPMLLQGSAIEAIAEMQKDKKFAAPSIEVVQTFISETSKGKTSTQDITKRVRLVQHETEKGILFETRDESAKAMPVRLSLIAK